MSFACSRKFAGLPRFSYELLHVSIERRLYLHPFLGPTFSLRLEVLLCRIVVEPSPIRSLAAEDPFLKVLGLHLDPSSRFFLLSSPSHLSVFHLYAVVLEALRDCQQLNQFLTRDFT
jgi:hypothetical protein